jgi:D-threo-aldose 1-dehydrogenase
MRYRSFGQTGIDVSELVFGGGAVGGLLINQDDATKLEAVKIALDAGVNWIDTAASYGDGQSETAIGWILKEVEPQPHISTKFTIDTRNPDFLGQIERSVTMSLERLQLNKVTLLQLHNSIGQETSGRSLGLSDLLKPHGILDAMDSLRQQGMFDHIGITALGEVPAIIKVLKSNRLASAQVYFNLLNPSAAQTPSSNWPYYNFTGIVSTCVEHGVAPMNIRVLSAGVLATTNRHGREAPLTPGDTVESETHKADQMFTELGEDFGTHAQTAIRFALAEPRLACVVTGLAEISHLREALDACQSGPLPVDALERISAVYQNYAA